MSLWEERAARNEALFREVNEQAQSLHAGRATERRFVCECSDASCTLQIGLPSSAYEAVRADPRQFLVAPGHEGAFEVVVERHPDYLIVRKEGRAREIAEQTDPRQ
jgi:hypothetical protein